MNIFDRFFRKQKFKDHTRRINFLIGPALCFFISLIFFAQSGLAETTIPTTRLIAAGSGANLEITRRLIEAFSARYPQIPIDVPGSIGSKGAIEAVNQGAINFGLISRSLTEKEKELGLVVQPYALTAIVVAVHAGVPDNAITTQDLLEIFKGTKTQWSNGSQIIVQARDKTDSGFLTLQEKLHGFKEVYQESHDAKRWTLYFNDQDANSAIAKVPSAIGLTDLGMIATENLPVKALTLDGVTPNLETLAKGTYPLTRTLTFIYRNEHLTSDMNTFLSFVFSPEGQKVLKKYNYYPVR